MTLQYRPSPVKSLHAQLELAKKLYLKPACLILLLYWLCYNCFGTIQRIISYYTPLPTWDYFWRLILNVNEYRSFHVSALWIQHNEHRIIFPELVFAADVLLLHGRLILPLVISFLCYAATFAVLASTVCRDSRLTRFERLTAIALAGILVFWQGCANVLASPFLLQWTLMQFGTVCSLLFLSRMQESSSKLSLFGVIIAATVATYSSGNALVLWPLIVFGALLIRINKFQFIVLVSSAVIDLALYFVGYGFSKALNFRNFFVHPVYSLNYIASYLSMPFGGTGTPLFGVTAGFLSIGGTAVLFLIAVRKRIHLLPPAVVLFGYCAFTLLTALITAGGRMDPDDPLFMAAKAARYVSVPQMQWGVLILLCLWVVWRTSSTRQTGNMLAFVFAALFFVYLPKLTPWLSLTADSFAEQQLQALSVESGLKDKDILRKIYPDPAVASAGLSILQRLDLSLYYDPRGRWLGESVRLFAPVRSTMPGAITQVTPVDSGLQIIGWADFSEWKRPYRWVMITDESGKIIGFGSHCPAGFPRSVRTLTNPSPFGWVGFVSEKWQPNTISAYIVGSRRNELFPLANAVSVAQVHIGKE
jgi:hypothetical protein